MSLWRPQQYHWRTRLSLKASGFPLKALCISGGLWCPLKRLLVSLWKILKLFFSLSRWSCSSLAQWTDAGMEGWVFSMSCSVPEQSGNLPPSVVSCLISLWISHPCCCWGASGCLISTMDGVQLCRPHVHRCSTCPFLHRSSSETFLPHTCSAQFSCVIVPLSCDLLAHLSWSSRVWVKRLMHLSALWNQTKVLKNKGAPVSQCNSPNTVTPGHLTQLLIVAHRGWFLGSTGNQLRETEGPLKTGSSCINILPGREGRVIRHRQTFVETTIPLCVSPRKQASFFLVWLISSYMCTRTHGSGLNSIKKKFWSCDKIVHLVKINCSINQLLLLL